MALSVAACQSPAATDEATAPATVAAPGTVAVPEVEQTALIVASAVVDQHASPWEHVRTKYDADGDGVVSIEEYDRDGVQFAQLDLDNDGTLSKADFSRELSPTAPMLRMRIFRVLANYFQTDEDPSKFSMGELAEAFGIYDEDGDREVREAAIFALSQGPADEAVSILIRIVRTNKDPELVRSALFWLGQTSDARAIALYEEILTGGE